MGQIRKRGGVWWIRYYRDGRRFEQSSKSAAYDDARDLLRRVEGAIVDGVPMTPKIGQLRMTDAADDLLTNYRINGRKSVDDVERHLDKLRRAFGPSAKLANLTTADVERYAKQRQDAGAANATINRELAALKRMYTLAVRAKKLITKPHIPMLTENNARTGFFERDQFTAVRRQLTPVLQNVATVAYFTGWRTRSEILPMEWSQVDREAGVLRLEVGSTKTKKGRTFKYAAIVELRDAIEARWAAHEALKKAGTICPYVFERFDGKRVKHFRKAWVGACKAAGCPGRLPHDFRRTAVRNLTRAGVTDTIAMAVTGHRTRAVFDRYDITSEADLDDAATKLQTLVGTISGTNGRSETSTEFAKAIA
jgi:integrase